MLQQVPENAAGNDQQREAFARFLIVDADIAALVKAPVFCTCGLLRTRAARQAPVLVDPLQLSDLFRLVESRPHAPRAPEWRAFLAELQFLADADGRLPSWLERLVRVVLTDLLD